MVEPHLIDAEFRKAWLPYLCRSGHPEVSAEQFLGFIGHFLPQEKFLDLPRITGRDLHEVARAKKATVGGLDGWAWNEIKALPLPWFSGLAILLELVESTGTWPQGLSDAYIAMIPKADGDSTPLGQRPLSVLPVVYRLWASLRLGHLREWVEGWLPTSVVIFCGGLVVFGLNLLDMVNRGLEMVGFPQGCPLSMVFIVALYVHWCRHLDSLPDIKPQLYADNLKCSVEHLRALFESARFTARYVRSVGQDVSLGKCVLLSTSKTLRKAMKLWDISGEGSFWNVQLDVRDLRGHLDFTLRARAGTLSKRICGAISGVASVGALPLGFKVKLGLVRGKYLLAGLHAAEASSYVSSSSISAFRAAIVRAVWFSEMPLANAPAILLDGPVGVDLAFHIVWSRFRMMRRYLAYCPDDEPRIFRMLDLISRGAQGHGPVHLLLISAAELGFSWDGAERGWVRVSLPPLRMMTGPFQHFYSSILYAWRFHVFAKLSERKGFLGGEFSDFQGSLQLLTSSHLRERDKMLLRALLCGGVWNGFLLGKAKKEDVPLSILFICSGIVPFLPFSMFGIFLNLLILCSLTAASGPGVFFGMVDCLVSMAFVLQTPGLSLLVTWRPFILSNAWVLILLTLLVAGLFLTLGMLMILHWRCLIILMSGLMGAFLLWVVLKLLVLVCTSLLLNLLLRTWFGVRLKSMVMLVWSVAVIFLPVPGVMQTVQRAEFWGAILAMQAYWPCHLELTTLMLLVALVVSLILIA